MTKRPKCKTRGCSHRAAAKPSIKAYGGQHTGGPCEATVKRALELMHKALETGQTKQRRTEYDDIA